MFALKEKKEGQLQSIGGRGGGIACFFLLVKSLDVLGLAVDGGVVGGLVVLGSVATGWIVVTVVTEILNATTRASRWIISVRWPRVCEEKMALIDMKETSSVCDYFLS